MTDPATLAHERDVVSLPVDRLHVDGNPRSHIDKGELAALTASIKAQGVLDPLRVVENNDGWRIESGQRRWLAAKAAGLTHVPGIVIDADDWTESVAAVTTNVQRADMNPIEEAEAYLALIGKGGKTPKGVAEAVGVSQARVTSRLELLEMPQPIIDHYRHEALPLSARKALKSMAAVSAPLAVAVADAAAGKPDWGETIPTEPGRLARYIANQDDEPRFFDIDRVTLVRVVGRHGDNPVVETELELGEELTKRVIALNGAHSYFQVYTDEDIVDAARAAKVLYEGQVDDESSCAVCIDPVWLVDRVEQAVTRAEKAREQDVKREAKRQAEQIVANGGAKPTQAEQDDEDAKAFRRRYREAVEQGRIAAQAANAELGKALMDQLAVVDVGKLPLETERAIAYAMVAPNISELFLGGLRFCLPQFIGEETKGKGEKAKTVPVYTQTKTDAFAKATEWLLAGDKPGEAMGRALILWIACLYADQGVVAQSQRMGSDYSLPKWGDLSQYNGDNRGKTPKSPAELVKAVYGKPAAKVIPAALRGTLKPSQRPAKKLIEAEPELANKAGLGPRVS